MKNLIVFVVVVAVAAGAYGYFVDPSFFGLIEQSQTQEAADAVGEAADEVGDAVGEAADEAADQVDEATEGGN